MNVKHLILSSVVFVACLLATDVSAATINVPPKFISGTGLSSGLVGYWTFDGKDVPNGRANDVSGNANHGNMSGIATSTFYTTGKIGQAFNFDGVNDYVTRGDNLNIGANDVTMSSWIKAPNTNQNAVIMGKKASNNLFYHLFVGYFNSSGSAIASKQIGCAFYNGGGLNTNSAQWYHTTNDVVDGKWHHVVCTRSGTTIKIYVDGVDMALTTDIGGIVAVFTDGDAGGAYGIGARPVAGSMFYSGIIDDVRQYNRALSAAEVTKLYNQTSGSKQNTTPRPLAGSGLVGHWTFDGKDVVNGVARDVSGSGYHGNPTSIATSTFYTLGKMGQAFRFDGTDDYVNMGNVGEIKTLSYWINTNSNKFNAIPYAGDTFYKDGVNTGSLLGSEKVTNGTFAANVSSWTVNGVSTLGWVNDTSGDGSTGYARFTIDNNSSFNRFSQNITTIANTTYLLSFWYRTTGITGNMGVYFSADESTLANPVRSNSLIPSTSWRYFSVIVNTSALSFPYMSITKLGSIGSGTFDIDAISVKQLTNSIGTGWHHVVTTSSNAIYASLMSAGRFQDSSGFLTGTLDDVRTYSRALSAAEVTELYNQTSGSKQNATPLQPVRSGLVGHWTFDGKDVVNGVARDVSGNGNHGNLTSIATSTFYTLGKIGQGFRFDGVNDRISTSVQLPTSGAFTTSFWMKGRPTANSYLFIQDHNGSTDLGLYYIPASNGFGYKNEANTTDNIGGWTYNLDNNWHHIVLVESYAGDVDDASFYVDGIRITAPYGGTSIAPSIQNLQIGARNDNSLPYLGTLDDFRVYNRALSASEVLQLYNQGK